MAEAEDLEHAAVGGGSGDEVGNVLPVGASLDKNRSTADSTEASPVLAE